MNEILINKMNYLSPALLCFGLMLNQTEKYAEFFFNNENLMIFTWFTESLSVISFSVVIYINLPRIKKRLKSKEVRDE
jgi:hypothetical protein